MQLVGRETELAHIGRAVEDARGGESRTLGLFGEAGIGKSALLAALREQARAAGMLVLDARAAEHERDVPFGLVVDALDEHVAGLHPRRVESLGPELAAVLPAAAAVHAQAPDSLAAGPAERFRYHRALRALLELLARAQPVALLLDDLHWADDASVELVLHLLRRPPRGGHLLVFALRPQDPAPRLLAAARNTPGWERLAPAPLADEAARALLAGHVGDATLRDRVVREAAGNPLFLEELARAARGAATALPPTLVAAVRLEIEALPAGARRLLDGAAVAGDPFDLELAASIAGLAAAAAIEPLDRLVAADLVRTTDDGRAFAFRHPLVRRAVYDAAPPAARLAAHERAAATLAARGAGAALRAYHVEQFAVQGDRDAIAVLTEAGQVTGDTAPASAARWYEAALRLLPAGDHEGRAALLGPLALAQGAAGNLDAARDALDEVLGLLPPEPTRLRAQLVAATATVELLLGRVTECINRLTRALEAGGEGRAVLEVTLMVAAYYTLDFDAMRARGRRALEHVGADEVTVRAAAESGVALATVLEGEPEAGHAILDAALARISAAEDASLAARLDDPYFVCAALLLTNRSADGLPLCSRAMGIARETRQDRFVPMLAQLGCMMLENLLRLDGSLEYAEIGAEFARLQGNDAQIHPALMAQAGIHWLRGERSESDRLHDESVEIALRVEASTATATTRCNAAARWVDEDPERCIREMVAAGGPLLERADRSWSTWLMSQLVRAAVALGRLDEAETWTAHLEERARRTRSPANAARAAVARSALLVAQDRAAEGAELALAAAEAASGGDTQFDALLARLAAGRALAAAGEREAAVATLQRVAADASAGHAGLFVEAAGRELRRLGSRLAAGARRPGEADELTEREQAIAELVASGRSNKQVAAALFLSQKTIEHHLSRIYAKLGVRSRTELAARLDR